MFERFTDRARRVMQLANQEAGRLNHEYIGTEHLLLGIAKEGAGVAANVLTSLGVDVGALPAEIACYVESGPESVTIGKLPQTPRTKRIIEWAMVEARDLNHNYVGTEHLLLGIMHDDSGVAVTVLRQHGLTLESARSAILVALGVKQTVSTPFDDALIGHACELRHWKFDGKQLRYDLERVPEPLAAKVMVWARTISLVG